MLHNWMVNKCGTIIQNTQYMAWDSKREQKLVGYLAYIRHVDNAFYKQLKEYAAKLEDKYSVEIPFFRKKQLQNQKTGLVN